MSAIMPLVFQDWFTPQDLENHPDSLFLFGDNELRQGRGGQAAVCRGHANAVGIATKRSPKTTDNAYWSDTNYERQIAMLERDLAPAFAHIRRGGTVVCPSAGLGTGLAELPARAPRTFATLRQLITHLKLLGEAKWPEAGPHVLNKKMSGVPSAAHYCGRPSPLGNPFVIGKDGSRADVIRKHGEWIQTQPQLLSLAQELRGRDLVCFCAPLPCHCDNIRRLANPHLYPRPRDGPKITSVATKRSDASRSPESQPMPDTIPANTPLPQTPPLNTIEKSSQSSEAPAQSGKLKSPDDDPVKDLLNRLRLAQANIALVDPDLGRTIQNLIDRGADPERRAQPGFRTGLAYAVQDLEKLGISAIAIAPELRAQMTRLAATAPGLENERMQALLRDTPEIADRGVVRDIRSAARDIAKLADQHTPDVESRIDVLENQVRLAPRQAAQQATSETSNQKAAAGISEEPTNDQPRPRHETPSGAHERLPPGATHLTSQGNPPIRPPEVRVQERSGFAIDMVLGKMRPQEPKSPGLADPAYTPIGSRLSAFEEMIQAGRDERAFERAEKSGRAALDALNSLSKGAGASILGRVREAAKHEPGGMATVLSEMREGGRFADLRAQFNNALETERGFAAAYNQAAAALGRYGQDRSAVQDIIARRRDAEMLTARFERLDAKIGEAASETPGRRQGESMLQEMADKAAEILHRAIDAVKAAFSRNPSAQAAPSPSMSA